MNALVVAVCSDHCQAQELRTLDASFLPIRPSPDDVLQPESVR